MKNSKKKRYIIYLSVFIFLIVNSSYYWLRLKESWGIIITFFTFIGFITLIILLIIQFIKLIRFKFKNHITNIIFLLFVIITTIIFPFGIINFERFEDETILIAQREGVANCMTTFKLKENFNFTEYSVCFGRKYKSGKYIISNDTFSFYYKNQDSISKPAFAILKLNNDTLINNKDYFIFYRDDEHPLEMRILFYKKN